MDCYCNITNNCPCGTSGCGGGTPCSHCRFNSAAGNPMGSPMDVGGGSAGDDLYFYTNGAVGSVYTQLDDFSGGSCPSPLGQVVVVKLFAGSNAGGTFTLPLQFLGELRHDALSGTKRVLKPPCSQEKRHAYSDCMP